MDQSQELTSSERGKFSVARKKLKNKIASQNSESRKKVKVEWWKQNVIYQVYPRSFLDTTGSGVGDFKGKTFDEHSVFRIKCQSVNIYVIVLYVCLNLILAGI